MAEFAIWKRLDAPGHDAAQLRQGQDGEYILEGMTVFRHESEPACLAYRVDLAPDWSTTRGSVTGFIGASRFERLIEFGARGWFVDGVEQPELAHLRDLDFGFTPATNLQQLRRVAPKIGKAVDLPVAWLAVGADRLVELPQVYRRLDEHSYAYLARSVSYEATLILASNGFVRRYPGLWEMEINREECGDLRRGCAPAGPSAGR